MDPTHTLHNSHACQSTQAQEATIAAIESDTSEQRDHLVPISDCNDSTVKPALLLDSQDEEVSTYESVTCKESHCSLAPWLIEATGDGIVTHKSASVNMISASLSKATTRTLSTQLPSTSQQLSTHNRSITSDAVTLRMNKWLPKFVYSTSEGAVKFLIDTGAVQSFLVKNFRASKNFRARLIPEKFVVANGIELIIYGSLKMKLNISGKSYTHVFLVANVRTNLLGVEFLREHRLSLLWNPTRLAEASNDSVLQLNKSQ